MAACVRSVNNIFTKRTVKFVTTHQGFMCRRFTATETSAAAKKPVPAELTWTQYFFRFVSILQNHKKWGHSFFRILDLVSCVFSRKNSRITGKLFTIKN